MVFGAMEDLVLVRLSCLARVQDEKDSGSQFKVGVLLQPILRHTQADEEQA